MVRLKVCEETLLERKKEDFNSKMVRLKDIWGRATGKTTAFQFQNGAIKSEINQLINTYPIISIPKWCD